MAYITDFADWVGSFLELIENFVVNLTPGMMFFLGMMMLSGIVIYVFSMVITSIKGKKKK